MGFDVDQERGFVMVSDLVDPNDPGGRTYREINAEKDHGIPLGTLVEDSEDRIRLYVVRHDRDCDQTPLYALGDKLGEIFATGWPENSLKVVTDGK